MSVLQYPVHKQLVALLAIALLMLCTTSRASAESTVYSNPQVNVFLRFAKEKGPFFSEGYSKRVQVYRHGTFVRPSTFEIGDFGQLATISTDISNERWRSDVLLELEPYEQVIAIQADYKLSNGTQIPFKWDGKGGLPIQRHFRKTEASLEFVDVGLHSPKLENQPKQPEQEYVGMH